MKLVIVESPTKAKTISKFLGKDYKIKSSFGHIRDLPTKELGVDIKNQYEPKYVIPSKALARVRELKKMAKDAELVILATDEDREGEAISWHLVAALNLPQEKTQRIAFHEITKTAIQKALENPRTVDINLVNAQQARRILDRLVGYKLSPLLWKKIRKGLSAGRVQSVAVRLVVEREREIEAFKPEEYWEIEALLKKQSDPTVFAAKLWKKNGKLFKKLDVNNEAQATEIKKALEKSSYKVENIAKKELSKTPPPPFTTSTLQQAAGSYLGYGTKQTMRLAQQLYEGIPLENNQPVGLITYMRTDSVNLSLESMIAAQKKITEMFGPQYALTAPRFYKSKSKGAQEAHEAIRPTFPEKDPESVKQYLSPQQFKLYRLIWNRMVASQMAAAKIDSTTAEIAATINGQPDIYQLKATGSVVKFNGYLKLTGKTSSGETILPELQEQEPLNLDKVNATQKFTQPPSRYAESTLVKAMEENGIGRPSTYAPTISTILDRGYVEKDENKKLFPTEIGYLVNDLLVENFTTIVDYQFTAQMEERLDDIAEGKQDWINVVDSFYTPFQETLKQKTSEIQKVQTEVGRKCPECGAELLEKFGRYGKFIACSNYPTCKYTEKSEADKQEEAAIKKSVGNAQGEIICDKCGAPMVIKKGPYGSFLGCSRYPECKNIQKIENKLDVACPQCGKALVERRSKRGKPFYGCSGYPSCNFALWSKPTGETCPKCKSLLVFGPKGKIKCSNKECDFSKEAS